MELNEKTKVKVGKCIFLQSLFELVLFRKCKCTISIQVKSKSKCENIARHFWYLS